MRRRLVFAQALLSGSAFGPRHVLLIIWYGYMSS
jgi:hypothetical protein